MNEDMAAIPGRLQARQRTGDINTLWPDVLPEDRHLAHAAILEATRAILTGDPGRPQLRAQGARERRALSVAAFASGMGPLLGWWMEQGRLGVSPETEATLAQHLRHGRRRVAFLRAVVARTLDALREASVEAVLLKGLHTGATYFPEPGTRPAGDIDFLIHPHQRQAATQALQEAGFREARRTIYSSRSEWVPAGVTPGVRSLEFDHADNPWCIDLHTALERWYFRGVTAGFGAAAFVHQTNRQFGGMTVRTLAQPLLTGFLALHASYELANMRLVRLVELVLVIRQDVRQGTLKWDELEALLAETRTTRFAYPALALAEYLAPGTVDPAWRERAGALVTPRMNRVLGAVRAAHLADVMHRSLDDKLMWARSPADWLLNLSELVWPSDDAIAVARLFWQRARMLGHGRARLRAHDD